MQIGIWFRTAHGAISQKTILKVVNTLSVKAKRRALVPAPVPQCRPRGTETSYYLIVMLLRCAAAGQWQWWLQSCRERTHTRSTQLDQAGVRAPRHSWPLWAGQATGSAERSCLRAAPARLRVRVHMPPPTAVTCRQPLACSGSTRANDRRTRPRAEARGSARAWHCGALFASVE